jgi:hypothetical protein
MKILLLILLLFVPEAAAAPPWPPSKCTNILKFVEILVPTENRNLLISKWRVFLNGRLSKNKITMVQYDALKTEILEANQIINKLEAKGYKGNEIVGLAFHHCAI